MNKLETAEAILVMQAWIDGEELEYKDHVYPENDWRKVAGNPLWSLSKNSYRIKPKPREFWIDLTDNAFIECGTGSRYWGEENELIKVREVLDENL